MALSIALRSVSRTPIARDGRFVVTWHRGRSAELISLKAYVGTKRVNQAFPNAERWTLSVACASALHIAKARCAATTFMTAATVIALAFATLWRRAAS